MPKQDKSKQTSLEIPLEVLEAIGIEYLPTESGLARNAALMGLHNMCKQHGKEWVIKNAKVLRDQLKMLENF